MARTKKKRNYKKAPKNTRVFRCVQKVKKKHEIGAAIAICQSSTKQSYRTGRSLKGGNGKKKVKIPKKGIAETDRKGLPKQPYIESDIDKYKNLPAFKDDRERILVGGMMRSPKGIIVPKPTFSNIEQLKNILAFYSSHTKNNKVIVKGWDGAGFSEYERVLKPKNEQTSLTNLKVEDDEHGIPFEPLLLGSFKIKPKCLSEYLQPVTSSTSSGGGRLKKRGGVTQLTTELPINTPQKIKDLIRDHFTDPQKIQLGNLLMSLRSKNPRPTEQQLINTIVNIVEQYEHYLQQQQQQQQQQGGAPKFLCGADKDFVPEVHYNELESILENLKKKTDGTALEDIVDKLPSIRKDKGKCYNCKKLIDELVENTMPSFVGPKILPIENDDILWLQQFTGVHKGRMCTIMGGRRKKKTRRRKRRGGDHIGGVL